ncbi:BTAD domain-containing putative transcriptional regulator [Kitasatospora sp. NPDC057015]|uniref:AfsR/SARP family transcriptional regulator n=1 Tax=Kitasatospora sp. NPDC057015 TaxID=3346001 RepID=UPI003635CDC9
MGDSEKRPAHGGDPVPDGERPTRFTVLGLLAIADSREVAVLQPSKPAALLAALLVRPNTVVSVESLQRVIWGEETPATAKAALQTCVLRLRRLFGKYGISGNTIEAVPGGYRMAADTGTLDLLQFRALLARAAALTDPGAELDLLRSALALWQLPVLGNVHSDVLHLDEVPRLTEEWVRTTERIFEIQLALGRCREALAELRPVAHSHPLHERFWEQLVEALHRTGRRAEALAEYRRVEEHLRAELGVGPGPALRHLEGIVLSGEPWPAGRLPDRSADPGAFTLLGPAAHPRRPEPAEAPGLPDQLDRLDGVDQLDQRGADRGAGPGMCAPASGELVLASLVRAGLLEEWPQGRYRMHELLRTFTRAATLGRRPAPPPHRAERPPGHRTERSDHSEHPNRSDHSAEHSVERPAGAPEPTESPRQPAAPLRPTEV